MKLETDLRSFLQIHGNILSIAPRNDNIYLFKVLNNDCPVDMGRRARLGNKDCHFLSDAAQGKLNCRVHSQGKCVGSLGALCYAKIQRWSRVCCQHNMHNMLMCRCSGFEDLTGLVNHCCTVHKRRILETF